MSNLGTAGISPLRDPVSGVRSPTPPQLFVNRQRRPSPTGSDYQNYDLGCYWLYWPFTDPNLQEVWQLVSLQQVNNAPFGKWVLITGPFGTVVKIVTDEGTANPNNGEIDLFAHPLSGGTVKFSVVPDGINTINLSVTDGNANTTIGALSGYGLTTGSANTVLGYSSGVSISTGQLNTIVGFNSGLTFSTGTNNTILGGFSGTQYLTNESGNILLGAAVTGTTGESCVLRIGDGTGANPAIGNLNTAIIAGIYNRPIGATRGVVMCDNTDVLGSSNGANGQILIGGGNGPVWGNITSNGGTITVTNGGNTINIDTAGVIAEEYPTDSGTAVPAGGSLNVFGTAGEISTSGAGNTITIGLDSTFYQAGTWTPSLQFGGASTGITYDFRGANYTRIGNIVFISCQIDLSSKGSATGAATITGIPIPGIIANAHQDFSAQSGRGITFDPGYSLMWGNMDGGSTITLNEGGFPATFQGLSDTNFAGNAQFTIQGFYYVA